MKKFYEIKNFTKNSADIYIYGEIRLEKERNYWTGEVIENDTDVYLTEFKKTLENLGEVDQINLYVNSPGGDVFVTSTIISMLKRIKAKGTKIEAYIDGLAASAASVLVMVADTIHVYKNSVLMIHKPMTYGFGNANDLQKVIDELNQVENSTIIPMYMEKVKDGIAEEKIKSLVNDESWLGANEIEEYFNVELEEGSKAVAACISKELASRYKNVPKNLIKNENIEEVKPKIEKTEEHETNEINDDKEVLIRNKLNLISASLFIKKNKIKKEGI